MVPSPPLGNCLLLENVILRMDALQHTGKDRRQKHIRMFHCTLHAGSDVCNNLERVGNLSGTLLLNNNLLVRRSRSCVLSTGRRVTHNSMRYTVEPQHVPLLIPPIHQNNNFHDYDSFLTKFTTNNNLIQTSYLT